MEEPGGVVSMCDMCSSPEAVYRIELEGTRLNVCEKCASYGRIITKLKQEEAPEKKRKKEKLIKGGELKPKKESETLQIIVPNSAQLIKNKREEIGLKQKELAKRIAEKESVIHKLESGRMKPDLALARKLEKFLKIKLVEEVELAEAEDNHKKRQGLADNLTIGDLINI